MDSNLIPTYNQFLNTIKNDGITKITCNELFERYKSHFNDKYELFKLCLTYLEQQDYLKINRTDFDDDFFISVEML